MTERYFTLRPAHISIVPVLVILIAIAVTFSSPLPKDESEFREVVAAWVVNGTSVTYAKRQLESNGFKVHRGKPRKQWQDQRDYLYGTRQKYIFPLFNREWRVICSIGQEEGIVEIKTMIFLHAP